MTKRVISVILSILGIACAIVALVFLLRFVSGSEDAAGTFAFGIIGIPLSVIGCVVSFVLSIISILMASDKYYKTIFSIVVSIISFIIVAGCGFIFAIIG